LYKSNHIDRCRAILYHVTFQFKKQGINGNCSRPG